MFTPEELICEGWVQKESRLLLEWRTRWLVLYRDHVSQLPVLCTFKDARCDWDLAAMPEPTERIDLVGCSCGIQADPSLDDPNHSYWLLGDVFLGQYYSVWNVAQQKIGFAKSVSEPPSDDMYLFEEQEVEEEAVRLEKSPKILPA